MAYFDSQWPPASHAGMRLVVHWQTPSAFVLPLCMSDSANIAAVRQVAPSLVLGDTAPAAVDADVDADGGTDVGVVVVVVVAHVEEASAGDRTHTPDELRARTPLALASACLVQDSSLVLGCVLRR